MKRLLTILSSILLTILVPQMMPAALALDLPSGSMLVYRGSANSTQDNVYFHAADGTYWLWTVKKSNDSKVNESRYSGLSAFRAELLAINDESGIMGSSLWKTDTDGDGYSDMLEYLTNSDPYNSATVPIESRVLSLNNGQTLIPLLPAKDIAGNDAGDEAQASDSGAVAYHSTRNRNGMDERDSASVRRQDRP